MWRKRGQKKRVGQNEELHFDSPKRDVADAYHEMGMR